jgi:predicted amidohydrolase YtcJ
VGDGAIDRVLDAMEAAGGGGAWRHRRTRMEHGDLLFPANFDRVRDLGVVVVQNARHLALPGVLLEHLGPATFGAIQPLRSLLDEGIPLALGTDGIGQVSSPWLDVFLAAIHPTRPTEALTVEEAVIAYTRGAAYAEFEEHRKGTLEPGNLADLAILSQDVFTVPLGALPATWSVMTMVGGEIVWDAGVL